MLQRAPCLTVGLLRGAVRGGRCSLRPGGQLLVYGPFKVSGEFIGDDDGAGNRKFDAKLRENSVEWGLRDVNDLNRPGGLRRLEAKKRIDMPANAHCCQFVKVRTGPLGRIVGASCEVVLPKDVDQITPSRCPRHFRGANFRSPARCVRVEAYGGSLLAASYCRKPGASPGLPLYSAAFVVHKPG